MVNDFEPVVFARRPALRRFRDDLLDLGAQSALLCGSGSTVFGVFGSAEERDRAQEALRSRYGRWRLVGTRTVPDAVRWAVDP
jgi:4-diphosphocytidyl-2-C-methyl-D-erythritol kinase